MSVAEHLICYRQWTIHRMVLTIPYLRTNGPEIEVRPPIVEEDDLVVDNDPMELKAERVFMNFCCQCIINVIIIIKFGV